MTRVVWKLLLALTVLASLLAGWNVASAQQTGSVSGDYVGTLGPLSLKLHIKAAPDGTLGGTLDSPNQGAHGIPCNDFRIEGATLSFKVPQSTALGKVQSKKAARSSPERGRRAHRCCWCSRATHSCPLQNRPLSRASDWERRTRTAARCAHNSSSRAMRKVRTIALSTVSMRSLTTSHARMRSSQPISSRSRSRRSTAAGRARCRRTAIR